MEVGQSWVFKDAPLKPRRVWYLPLGRRADATATQFDAGSRQCVLQNSKPSFKQKTQRKKLALPDLSSAQLAGHARKTPKPMAHKTFMPLCNRRWANATLDGLKP